MCCSRPSPLDTLDTTFHLLAGGPQPLALEGRIIGLQRESIGLLDLRALLFLQRRARPCNVLCLRTWSGAPEGIVGSGSLVLPASCCRASWGRLTARPPR